MIQFIILLEIVVLINHMPKDGRREKIIRGLTYYPGSLQDRRTRRWIRGVRLMIV